MRKGLQSDQQCPFQMIQSSNVELSEYFKEFNIMPKLNDISQFILIDIFVEDIIYFGRLKSRHAAIWQSFWGILIKIGPNFNSKYEYILFCWHKWVLDLGACKHKKANFGLKSQNLKSSKIIDEPNNKQWKIHFWVPYSL